MSQAIANPVTYSLDQLTPDILAAIQAGVEGNEMAGTDSVISDALSFPYLSLKGRLFRIKEGEEETPLGVEQAVVVLAHYPHGPRKTAKSYYAGDYEEGKSGPPDCMSFDGITPWSGISEPQNTACNGCEHNVWGSGKSGKGRACRDEYRLAVVRLEDIQAGVWSPLLLLVSPAALKGYRAFRKAVQSRNLPLNMVAVTLKFDERASYPLLTFPLNSIQLLDKSLLPKVIAEGNNPLAREMVGLPTSDTPVLPSPAPVQQAAPVAAAPVAVTPAAPAPAAPVQAEAPAPAAPAPVTPAPVQQVETLNPADDLDMDATLAALDAIAESEEG